MPRKAEKRPGITGQRIASLRRRAELTQQELADQMNARGLTISAGLIKLMEAGRASVTDRTIEKYMAFFRCSREYITGEDASPYTGALRSLTSETVKEELIFRAGLAALIHRSVSPDRIGALAFHGKLDETDLYSRAYDHMIRFVEAELRKAEEAAGEDLPPAGAAAALQQIGRIGGALRKAEGIGGALDQFRTARKKEEQQ